MFFPQHRHELRRMYFNAWDKAQKNLPLEPLEQQIAQVVIEHPEYQRLIADPNLSEDIDFSPEMGVSNPFLHLGLHLAIREQVACNRPAGILKVYQQLSQKLHSSLEAEHHMMEYLVESLWQSQRYGTLPDEAHYLQQLQQLVE